MNNQYRVAFLMALAAMFTLMGYEFMRSAATVLFKSAYGASNLPLVMAAMPFVVFAGVALYGRLLSKLGPRRTLMVTSMGSGLLILCCYFLVLSGSKVVTPVLYLIKELYIVLLIEQYWSYINSSISADTAKKVNGPITGMGGLGAAIGATFVATSAETWGTESMLLFAALALVPAAFISNYAYRTYGEPAAPVPIAEPGSKPGGGMGWRALWQNKTLTYLLAIVFISQIVSAVLDLKFQGLLSVEFAGRMDEETAYQGWFWATLNSSVLLLQFVLAPLLLTFVPLRLVHIIMPTIHLCTITYATYEPSVFSVGLALFLFKALDYSFFRAAKEMLYVPMSFDARYRAKEIIDVFGYRTGKGASSVLIVLLQRAGILMSNYYLAMGIVATLVWLALIFPLTKHAKATQD